MSNPYPLLWSSYKYFLANYIKLASWALLGYNQKIALSPVALALFTANFTQSLIGAFLV